MTYASQVQITANTAWKTWYTASHHATEATEAAIDWYVETFFSAEAQARYLWVGQMIACLAYLAFLYGKQARAFMAAQVDETTVVEQALVTPEVETSVATPLPPLTQRLEALKGPQLRRLCAVKGIKARKMKVAEMKEVLATTFMD